MHLAVRNSRPVMVLAGPVPDDATEYIRADIADDLLAACEAVVKLKQFDDALRLQRAIPYGEARRFEAEERKVLAQIDNAIAKAKGTK